MIETNDVPLIEGDWRALTQIAEDSPGELDLLDELTKLCECSLEFVDVNLACIVLERSEGDFQVFASSNESAETLELVRVHAEPGPLLKCMDTGQPVMNYPVVISSELCPAFAQDATEPLRARVHCLPLRWQGRTIGALELL